MPRLRIYPDSIAEAVEAILYHLEDTSSTAHKAIYFDGWSGVAASAVLRAIAKDPPPSYQRKFDEIIHIDCSRWESRRVLQRIIVQELKLPHRVMDILDRQDEEDDFRGVDERSRAEIPEVGEDIYGAMREQRYLVVFNNGAENTVDMNDFGIPLSVWGTRVLWTFRGRLRLNSKISKKVDTSHLYLYCESIHHHYTCFLKEEAREITGYSTCKFVKVVEECFLYLLSLNSQSDNYATHASSYWVCDGIIEGGQADKAWEVAAALHQQIHMEDYSSDVEPTLFDEHKWIFARDNSIVHPESTSFFLTVGTSMHDPPLRQLPNDMFHHSDKLGVLKLCHCTFSFSWPPFQCCRSLRFLGLDGCKDQGAEEDDKKDRSAMDFFKSLWVLDICYTDWELDLSPEVIQHMAVNMREVHIKNGRFWHINFAWRQLQNLRKLRVIEPTCPWETGKRDEFIDMVKMELLDLSGNSLIQVMSSLSGATILKYLVLDGCVDLEHVGPDGLPPLLESFSLDVGPRRHETKEAKISRISLAGCSRLVKFNLCGSLPNLEEIDLSGTLVKTLCLKDEVVQVPSLQQIILLGCLQLKAILWPEMGLPELTVLTIGSLVCRVQTTLHQAYAAIMDIRFLQTLVLESNDEFCWNSTRFHLNLCVPSTTGFDEQSYKKTEKTGPGSTRKISPHQPKLLTPNTYSTYTQVAVDNIAIDHDCNKSGSQFQPYDCHVEIGEGISSTTVKRLQGIKAVKFVMNKAESLHVHDNCSITTVIPEHMISTGGDEVNWHHLKRCHVVRCPKIHTVFITNHHEYSFEEIETFWAADLLTAHCIWSKGRSFQVKEINSFARLYSIPIVSGQMIRRIKFAELRSIHLYSCPRLAFVLTLSWDPPDSYFPNLETLHIVNCGDLVKVFPVEPMLLRRITTDQRKGVLGFPKLKHIYLQELHKLQNICEAKMFAPKLETFRVRGCWGLRRLPAVCRDLRHPWAVGGYTRPRCVVVDCEEDWWEKLEWDGLEAGHEPSHFKQRHSSYNKKHLPRVSVLR